MRKHVIKLAALVMAAAIIMSGYVYAAQYVPYIAMQLDNPEMSVNGTILPLDDNGTKPMLHEGSAMLPITALVDALNLLTEWNLSVSWEPYERKVTLISHQPMAELWIERTTAIINGVQTELAVAPILVGGRTLVPLRVVSEALGLHVEWVGERRAILISFSSSGLPEEIVYPPSVSLPVSASVKKDDFRPVTSKEEVYGIWEFTEYGNKEHKKLYAMRFEERYLLSVYQYGGANSILYGPGYKIADGVLSYSYALVTYIYGNDDYDYEETVHESTPENFSYNQNDFYYNDVQWSIDISADGKTLRLSREAQMGLKYAPVEYKTIIWTYTKTS